MPNEKLTEIVVLLDRSGSMSRIQIEMMLGWKTFMDEQLRHPDPAVVSLYQFDDQFEAVYEERAIRDAVLVLRPRGDTALLDAMGRAITLVGERLAKKREEHRPGKVVFLVITDGMENRSHEFSRLKIAEMVKHQQEKYGWQFAFLGSNLDSFAEAQSLGIERGAVANFQSNAAGVQAMYGASSRGLSAYRSATGRDAKLNIGEQPQSQVQPVAAPIIDPNSDLDLEPDPEPELAPGTPSAPNEDL